MKILLYLFLLLPFFSSPKPKQYILTNPEKTIRVEFGLDSNKSAYYRIFHESKVVLDTSRLGLIREDASFHRDLHLIKVQDQGKIEDSYSMLHGKQKNISYRANKYLIELENSGGEKMEMIFQISDDGVAFKYRFPGNSPDVKKIENELTEYSFPASTSAWLQPMSKAKTGWNSTNPSYEEPYLMKVSAGVKSPLGEGFVYPALFKINNSWMAISEAGLGSNYVGTRLVDSKKENTYEVGFPQKEEVFPEGALGPESKLPWSSPWRIITIGDLATVVNSTLGTDLAEPAANQDTDYIEPGLSSWSWVLLKDDFTNYETTKRFIDYAAEMRWEYTLIDADWDQKIGYERLRELVDYAKKKDVKILVWYNSAGSWNTTPYTPRNKLLSAESRNKEFEKLKDIGVAGIKVDFFGGDGQSMIKYYHDILQDAADHELVLNFHGATLPRGWHRTYPNLLTVEAVKGYEFITFEQQTADRAPAHIAMLPFTRNLFDPMDFTPMVLDSIPGIERKTSRTFELALPVLLLSGIQHIAEIPEGMAKQPQYIKEYLQDIPVNWDESRFISGFPGKSVVIARRKGDTWHIVGVNGENVDKEITVDLSFLEKKKNGILITDGEDGFVARNISVEDNQNMPITLKGNGGFVMKF